MRLEVGGRGTGNVGGNFWSGFVLICNGRTEVTSRSRAQLPHLSFALCFFHLLEALILVMLICCDYLIFRVLVIIALS